MEADLSERRDMDGLKAEKLCEIHAGRSTLFLAVRVTLPTPSLRSNSLTCPLLSHTYPEKLLGNNLLPGLSTIVAFAELETPHKTHKKLAQLLS